VNEKLYIVVKQQQQQQEVVHRLDHHIFYLERVWWEMSYSWPENYEYGVKINNLRMANHPQWHKLPNKRLKFNTI
jgi:hypothetical protein